jgi:hypothetical protein
MDLKDMIVTVVYQSADGLNPAQVVENRSAVNADYWHPVREKLRECFGPDLCILGWIGASGDQSPHPIYRQAAEERMIKDPLLIQNSKFVTGCS